MSKKQNLDDSMRDGHPLPQKAPFPYFGGKSKVASLVWERLGNVDNYVEPFGGSLAVLLARPHEHKWWEKKESAGDYAGHVVNFYRSVLHDPTAVAKFASNVVSEADLTARHLYLVRYNNELAEKLAADPFFFDAQAAGWWIWGISCWIGGDWMTGAGPWKPGIVGSKEELKKNAGVYRKMPMVAGSHGGKGIHKPILGLPIDAEIGFPHLQMNYEEDLQKLFTLLGNRLRRVRLTCGDWSRLTGAAIDPGKGKITGIFLDPPYDLSMRREDLYSADREAKSAIPLHQQARDWALTHGDNPAYRIAYCSYGTEEETLLFQEAGWTSHSWSAHGGYGLQSNNLARDNKDLEMLWFSPACLPVVP